MYPDATSPVSKLVDQIEKLELEVPELGKEFRYASLPLCVIDAVFSIRTSYKAVTNVVDRFCEHTGWKPFASSRENRGPGDCGIQDMISIFEKTDAKEMAVSVFKNTQLTSSQSGILKAKAVEKYCGALAISGIDNFKDLHQDGPKGQEQREFAEAGILGIRGQSSGISFNYFMMLAGDNDRVKADRWVMRFVSEALHMDIMQHRQAAILVRLAAIELRRRHQDRHWTATNLDHAIWKHQTGKR